MLRCCAFMGVSVVYDAAVCLTCLMCCRMCVCRGVDVFTGICVVVNAAAANVIVVCLLCWLWC